jgi:hypothetical protein
MARVTKNLINNLDFRSTGMGFGIKGACLTHVELKVAQFTMG